MAAELSAMNKQTEEVAPGLHVLAKLFPQTELEAALVAVPEYS
jgi:hypothetical protein